MVEDNPVEWSSLQENKKEKVPWRRGQRGRESYKRTTCSRKKEPLNLSFSVTIMELGSLAAM